MKVFLIFSICYFIEMTISHAQAVSGDSALLSKVKIEEYSNFLNHFYLIDLPFNYKKDDVKIRKGEINLELMSEKEAIQFLHKKENELYNYKILYNYDTDESKKVKQKNLPAYQFKYNAKEYILLCIRETKGELGDTGIVNIITSNSNGKLIDQFPIIEQITHNEFDWTSFVLPEKGLLKVFHYEINMENYDAKYNIKDKTKPRTIVKITDYEISISGIFKKIKEYPIMYLKNDVAFYKIYHSESDDPMNAY